MKQFESYVDKWFKQIILESKKELTYYDFLKDFFIAKDLITDKGELKPPKILGTGPFYFNKLNSIETAFHVVSKSARDMFTEYKDFLSLKDELSVNNDLTYLTQIDDIEKLFSDYRKNYKVRLLDSDDSSLANLSLAIEPVKKLKHAFENLYKSFKAEILSKKEDAAKMDHAKLIGKVTYLTDNVKTLLKIIKTGKIYATVQGIDTYNVNNTRVLKGGHYAHTSFTTNPENQVSDKWNIGVILDPVKLAEKGYAFTPYTAFLNDASNTALKLIYACYLPKQTFLEDKVKVENFKKFIKQNEKSLSKLAKNLEEDLDDIDISKLNSYQNYKSSEFTIKFLDYFKDPLLIDANIKPDDFEKAYYITFFKLGAKLDLPLKNEQSYDALRKLFLSRSDLYNGSTKKKLAFNSEANIWIGPNKEFEKVDIPGKFITEFLVYNSPYGGLSFDRMIAKSISSEMKNELVAILTWLLDNTKINEFEERINLPVASLDINTDKIDETSSENAAAVDSIIVAGEVDIDGAITGLVIPDSYGDAFLEDGAEIKGPNILNKERYPRGQASKNYKSDLVLYQKILDIIKLKQLTCLRANLSEDLLLDLSIIYNSISSKYDLNIKLFK